MRMKPAWLHVETPRGGATCGDVMTLNQTSASRVQHRRLFCGHGLGNSESTTGLSSRFRKIKRSTLCVRLQSKKSVREAVKKRKERKRFQIAFGRCTRRAEGLWGPSHGLALRFAKRFQKGNTGFCGIVPETIPRFFRKPMEVTWNEKLTQLNDLATRL